METQLTAMMMTVAVDCMLQVVVGLDVYEHDDGDGWMVMVGDGDGIADGGRYAHVSEGNGGHCCC